MFNVYNARMNKTLTTLNRLARHGRAFTTFEFREVYGGSATSAANALSRAVRQGFLERVAQGRYSVRELGQLSTKSSTEDLVLALSPLLLDKEHRIAYLTALEYHSLLLYPQSEFQVALAAPTRTQDVSGRRFRQVIEVDRFLGVGAIEVDHGCRVSDVSRALLDAARRPDLIGGVDITADALRLAEVHDASAIVEYAHRLEATAALRRLGSIANTIGQREMADQLRLQVSSPDTPIPIGSRSEGDEVVWIDPEWNVTWDEMSADLIGLSIGT